MARWKRWVILGKTRDGKRDKRLKKRLVFKNKKKSFRMRNWLRKHGRPEARVVELEVAKKRLDDQKARAEAAAAKKKAAKKKAAEKKAAAVKHKWSPLRDRVRAEATRRGLVHTSGNRSYNTLASVGRVSDHFENVSGSWADDYWHSDMSVMREFAKWIRSQEGVKQILVHDAGSGDHVHVAGWSSR